MPHESEICIPVSGRESSFPTNLSPEVETLPYNELDSLPDDEFLKEGKILVKEFPDIFDVVPFQENGFDKHYYIVSRRACFNHELEGYTEGIVFISEHGISFIYTTEQDPDNLLSKKAITLQNLHTFDAIITEAIETQDKNKNYVHLALDPVTFNPPEGIVFPTATEIIIPKEYGLCNIKAKIFL